MAGNISAYLESVLDGFARRLEESVGRRVLNMFVSSHILSKAAIPHLFPSPPRDQGDAARLAILFSGGIDCAVIAYLAHKCVILHHKYIIPPESIIRFLPIDEPIDLLNVAFENPRSLKAKQRKLRGTIDTYDVPDRQTGLEQLDELRSMCPHRQWNFVRPQCMFDVQ
jgi:asparagine synthetase B (glutamine-hydrolysing)